MLQLRHTGALPVVPTPLAAWFEEYLSEDSILSSKPSKEYTRWGRWIFPMGKCIEVEKGSTIAAFFQVNPEGPGRSKTIWRISTDSYSFSSEDRTMLTR